MELSKLRVGQLVEHDNGFIGEIISIDATDGRYTDVNIRVVDRGTSFNEEGSVWVAMPEYINRIVKDVNSNIKTKVEIDVDINGLEDLQELVAQATEALELLSDATPFKANIQGVEFEGTPAQFESFVATMTKYLGNLS